MHLSRVLKTSVKCTHGYCNNCRQRGANKGAHGSLLLKPGFSTNQDSSKLTWTRHQRPIGKCKLTVKVPWKVGGSQAVKRYSVMDLGRDSPVLIMSFLLFDCFPVYFLFCLFFVFLFLSLFLIVFLCFLFFLFFSFFFFCFLFFSRPSRHQNWKKNRKVPAVQNDEFLVNIWISEPVDNGLGMAHLRTTPLSCFSFFFFRFSSSFFEHISL